MYLIQNLEILWEGARGHPLEGTPSSSAIAYL